MQDMKLPLYVFIASITAFLMQFGMQVVDKGIDNLSLVNGVVWVLIVGNTLLQGAIAWQAKLSKSPEQAETEEAIINTLKGLRNEVRNK